MARILIIDDSDDFRAILHEVLVDQGYEVVDAADGEEGVKLYREDPTDLVITDMIMPKKSGLETIIELRKDFPDVKVIAISGGGLEGPENYLEGARLVGGAFRTIKKPVAMNEVLKAVKESLEK